MSVARHLLAASLLTLATPAFAADIDILAAPEIAIPVAETGLYLRADATYGFDTTFGGTQSLVGTGGTATNRMGDWRLDDGFGDRLRGGLIGDLVHFGRRVERVGHRGVGRGFEVFHGILLGQESRSRIAFEKT